MTPYPDGTPIPEIPGSSKKPKAPSAASLRPGQAITLVTPAMRLDVALLPCDGKGPQVRVRAEGTLLDWLQRSGDFRN